MELPNVDLKKTVNLPKTAFSMKANLPQTEPQTLARWESERLYHAIRASRQGRPLYVLHDGPPYANGRIHMGTAFNKILKDFIVKSKTMAGFDSPYVPGWDCHGLPIEIKVDNELGARKAHMPALEIRRACRQYAEKYIDLQRQDFKRLGVLGQWEDPYLTMSAHYQSVIAGAFVEFLDRGYVYKGLKPVHWCIKDRTALAEAEVEYENHSSPSILVRFRLTSDPARLTPQMADAPLCVCHSIMTRKGSGYECGNCGGTIREDLAGRRVYGLIWTTTPWTIPANMAIAYNPKYEYVAVDVAGDVYIVAAELAEVTAQKCGWKDYQVVARFPGSRMEHAIFRHPFLERDSLGILADHVTLEQGTGAVHTAPGHGQEDYAISRQYGIETYCPVDAGGRFFHATGAAGTLPEEIIGKTVWEANPIVIEILKSAGALLATELLEHSYPHCWRCHRPVIFRATEQWFIGMDRNDFRQHALDAIKQVRWMPSWGEERISNMIAVRPDWCISRQRVWGVPIIVFYCEQCREPLTDRKILDGIVELFREHTADVWYERTAAELLPPGFACPQCGGAEFRKETDILDVWFDSGSSHLAVLNERFGLPWPADIYMEGGDQYRGWFHSSLLVGTGIKGGSPYRACALNGWVLDGDGKAMHKSLGNSIEPEEIIPHYGAEIIRLWTASVDFHEDVRISKTILTRLVEAYRKLRNTFRYMLGNLSDFDPATDAVPAAGMAGIDQWILLRAEDLAARCRAWYDSFEFHKVYHNVYAFATVDLSAVYFDVLKDRLYTSATRSGARRSAQTALYRLLDALVRLLAPLMSFTAEEVWTHLGHSDSVHVAYFPEPSELSAGLPEEARKRSANWDRLMEVRGDVLKSLETARNQKLIGAPLEARVRLSANGDLYPLLQEYAGQLPALFIVSQVELAPGTGNLAVEVERAEGRKCERCWKYTTDVGADQRFPTVCGCCAEAVEEILTEPRT
ncbi:MAG: isoleucine--tRNA ligase [Bryobacteraceae bacterium]